MNVRVDNELHGELPSRIIATILSLLGPLWHEYFLARRDIDLKASPTDLSLLGSSLVQQLKITGGLCTHQFGAVGTCFSTIPCELLFDRGIF